MPDELTYDLMLEVKGVIRSISVRTTLGRELSMGETFDLRGRCWVVSKVDRVDRGDLDLRVVAREVDEPQIAA
jgi:hypothetical protein